MTATVFGFVILINIAFYNLNSPFFLGFSLDEKICQTVKTVFHHFSKHLEARQKYSAVATYRIFNSVLVDGKCGETLSFVSNILHKESRREGPISVNHQVNYRDKENLSGCKCRWRNELGTVTTRFNFLNNVSVSL